MTVWISLHLFHAKKIHLFCSLYKGLSEVLPGLISLACFIVVGNLQEVFRCSAKTDFMSTIFGF